MANWSNSMDQCSIYQMNDEISYTTQTTPSVASHMLANNHHYKHDISQQPSHNNHQGLRFQLQSQNQQIQNSNYHILSRHYLGQHHQQYHHYQLHQQAGRQHVNISSSVPLNSNGEPIKLPENLETLPKADHFPSIRHRWNTNEEIAGILINFERHAEWQSKEVKTRPKSGSMLLYSRKKVRYRRDGYCWKKRKDGKTTREDHMKLKVQGTECIYGCYVHSAILPTFHRRCYWLLQNPDIVLVHYLNVPYPDDRTQHNKLIIAPSLLFNDKKEWTKEELLSQLKPMFFNEDDAEMSRDIDSLMHSQTSETVEAIVAQLMEKQRNARQNALVKQLDQNCAESSCVSNGKHSFNTTTRNIHSKSYNDMLKRSDSVEHVSNANFNTFESKQPYQRWYSERHISTSVVQDKPQSTIKNIKVGLSGDFSSKSTIAANVMSHDTSNQSFCNKASNNIYNVHVNNIQSKTNNSILNPIGNDVGQQHGSMKNNNVIMNGMTDSSGNNSEIINEHGMKDNTDVNYQNIENHLMNFHHHHQHHDSHQKFDMSNEHISSNSNEKAISYNQQATRNNISSDTSLPLDLCQIQHSLSQDTQSPQYLLQNEREMDNERSIKKEQTSINNLKESGDDKKEESFTFNTTLDLSQEDIQQTLSANMPNHRNEESMNAINFIENCSNTDDDTFVNLDAFDMLVELPVELDELEAARNHLVSKTDNFNITEFCPDWSYVEGGMKVLITGPWNLDTNYTVYFDNISVKATTVQNGVLRVYAPQHEIGVAKVCVSDGVLVSNIIDFEYRMQPKYEYRNFEILYKFSLLHRLEAMENNQTHRIKEESNDNVNIFESDPDFENRLITYTNSLKRHEISSICEKKVNGMSILHLASYLGYVKLIEVLLGWRMESSNKVVRDEIDPLSQNDDGNTALMVACDNGCYDAALLLLKYDRSSLLIKNKSNKTALDICNTNGYMKLADELTNVISIKNIQGSTFLSSPCKTINNNCNVNDESYLNDEELDDKVFIHPETINSSLGSLHRKGDYQNILETTKRDHKSRSMSLPVTYSDIDLFSSDQESSQSGFQQVSSSSNNSLLSPMRKFDFTFCHTDKDQSNSSLSDDFIICEKTKPIDEPNVKVLNLAEKIIAALPNHIKNESDDSMAMELDKSFHDTTSTTRMNDLLTDSFMDSNFDQNFVEHFELEDYRYEESRTPCSSPASSGPLQSPYSYGQLSDHPRSPPVTTQDFTQFFEASNPVSNAFESDFSQLTLTDNEQRELYQAAKCIQKAYRSYKGRKKMEEQDKERSAAVIIQNYYRRYKEYAYYREMTHAALVIQNKYRSYCESKKRIKTSFNGSSDAPSKDESLDDDGRNNEQYMSANEIKEPTPTNITGLKRTYSQSTQNQAARKIQQFMLTAKNNFSDIRVVAERKTEKGRKREAERSSLGIPNKFCVSRTSTRSIFCQRPLTKKV
ncbi:calmodulin-binding transcription activator 2-like isoform X4 [Chironomus tepperi]|uniref:calmodulin-binding transcription activator 2-like isoform X4 n=1 Tax=Chironomus tepperi TaxID=113505 RepID=UPI00391F02DD